jgi:hypothetical protein
MKDEGDRDDLDQDPYSFKAQPYWVQWLVLVSAIVFGGAVLAVLKAIFS